MPYTGSAAQIDLVERVEYKADQVGATGQTKPINREGVYNEMEDSARDILRKVPREFCYAAASDGATAANGDADLSITTAKVIVPLPTDFIRFLLIRIDEWEVSVHDLLSPLSDRYRIQANSNAAADVAHPEAVLMPYKGSSSVRQVVECYPGSSASSNPVAELLYVADTAPESMPNSLVDAMLWDTTGRILQNQKDFGGATSAFEAALRSINALRIGRKGEDQIVVVQETGVRSS